MTDIKQSNTKQKWEELTDDDDESIKNSNKQSIDIDPIHLNEQLPQAQYNFNSSRQQQLQQNQNFEDTRSEISYQSNYSNNQMYYGNKNRYQNKNYQNKGSQNRNQYQQNHNRNNQSNKQKFTVQQIIDFVTKRNETKFNLQFLNVDYNATANDLIQLYGLDSDNINIYKLDKGIFQYEVDDKQEIYRVIKQGEKEIKGRQIHFQVFPVKNKQEQNSQRDNDGFQQKINQKGIQVDNNQAKRKPANIKQKSNYNRKLSEDDSNFYDDLKSQNQERKPIGFFRNVEQKQYKENENHIIQEEQQKDYQKQDDLEQQESISSQQKQEEQQQIAQKSKVNPFGQAQPKITKDNELYNKQSQQQQTESLKKQNSNSSEDQSDQKQKQNEKQNQKKTDSQNNNDNININKQNNNNFENKSYNDERQSNNRYHDDRGYNDRNYNYNNRNYDDRKFTSKRQDGFDDKYSQSKQHYNGSKNIQYKKKENQTKVEYVKKDQNQKVNNQSESKHEIKQETKQDNQKEKRKSQNTNNKFQALFDQNE